MSAASDEASTPVLDGWIDEIGEDQVLEAVRSARHAIESGATPGFTDREALLAYLGQRAAG